MEKISKEKSKLIQEKCQQLLNELLRDEDNKYCVDCDAKGPRWASWNLGLFLCIRCAGIHRNLGVHISKVKSVNLDTWTPEQLASMQRMGNSIARSIYEQNLPENFRRPQTDAALETFIRAKYEHKKYLGDKQIPNIIVKGNEWDFDEMRKSKNSEAKKDLFPKLVIPKKLGVVAVETVVKEESLFDLDFSSGAVSNVGVATAGATSATTDLSAELKDLSLNSVQKMSKGEILGLYNKPNF